MCTSAGATDHWQRPSEHAWRRTVMANGTNSRGSDAGRYDGLAARQTTRGHEAWPFGARLASHWWRTGRAGRSGAGRVRSSAGVAPTLRTDPEPGRRTEGRGRERQEGHAGGWRGAALWANGSEPVASAKGSGLGWSSAAVRTGPSDRLSGWVGAAYCERAEPRTKSGSGQGGGGGPGMLCGLCALPWRVVLRW